MTWKSTRRVLSLLIHWLARSYRSLTHSGAPGKEVFVCKLNAWILYHFNPLRAMTQYAIQSCMTNASYFPPDSADPAPEAPQLSDSDIHDLPPIDKVAKDVLARRSSGETIDQVLKKQYAGELEQEEKPMASAFLVSFFFQVHKFLFSKINSRFV